MFKLWAYTKYPKICGSIENTLIRNNNGLHPVQICLNHEPYKTEILIVIIILNSNKIKKPNANRNTNSIPKLHRLRNIRFIRKKFCQKE